MAKNIVQYLHFRILEFPLRRGALGSTTVIHYELMTMVL